MQNKRTADAKSGAPKLKLLLVDDDRRNLMALEAVLSDSLYHLVLAHSGPEALKLAKRHEFAVILLDIQMPGMDGFETARALKAIEACRDVPIIFITAFYPEDQFVRKGYAVGAIDYLTKPFDPEILRIKVDLYSALRQRNDLLREREKQVKQMEDLLRAERKLSSVLETHPVGIIIANAHGELCQVNEEVPKLWGNSKTADNETYAAQGLDDPLLEAVNGPLARVLRTGETSRNEFTRYTCPDGSSKTVLTSASALRNFDGTVVGVAVVIQDLTEHRHIEQDLVHRIYELASLSPEPEHQTQH
jgi:PAS domain S-box-containing protein